MSNTYGLLKQLSDERARYVTQDQHLVLIDKIELSVKLLSDRMDRSIQPLQEFMVSQIAAGAGIRDYRTETRNLSFFGRCDERTKPGMTLTPGIRRSTAATVPWDTPRSRAISSIGATEIRPEDPRPCPDQFERHSPGHDRTVVASMFETKPETCPYSQPSTLAGQVPGELDFLYLCAS